MDFNLSRYRRRFPAKIMTITIINAAVTISINIVNWIVLNVGTTYKEYKRPNMFKDIDDYIGAACRVFNGFKCTHTSFHKAVTIRTGIGNTSGNWHNAFVIIKTEATGV